MNKSISKLDLHLLNKYLIVFVFILNLPSFGQNINPAAHWEDCGPGIHWMVSLPDGDGARDGDLNWLYPTHVPTINGGKVIVYQFFGPITSPPPFEVDFRPDFPGLEMSDNFMTPYFEKTDLIFKHLDFPFSLVNDGHSAMFNHMRLGVENVGLGPGFFVPTTIEANADFAFLEGSVIGWGTATEVRAFNDNGISIDFFSETDDLINAFSAAYWRFGVQVATKGGNFGRGQRYIPELTFQNRKWVNTVARQIAEANIGYILDAMLDQNWFDWTGRVEDIDDIRCDGVVEFAYEERGVRLMGYDWWDLGSSSDDKYNKHNNVWVGFTGYNDGETSPMIQSGCGGFGDGRMTTVASRSHTSKPNVRFEIKDIDQNEAELFWYAADIEDDTFYGMLQVMNLDAQNPEWKMIQATDPSTYYTGMLFYNARGISLPPERFVLGKTLFWDGDVKDLSGVETIPVIGNNNYRLSVLDGAGNLAVKEFLSIETLNDNDKITREIRATETGMINYQLLYDNVESHYQVDVYAYYGNKNVPYLLASQTSFPKNDGILNIEFFVRDNQKLKIEISCFQECEDNYFSFTDESFVLARNYDISRFTWTGYGNRQVKFTNLPPAYKWAITWSRSDDYLKRNLEITTPTTTTIGTGDKDYEIIDGFNLPLSELTVFDPTNGSNFEDIGEGANIFTLWMVGGFSE